MKFLLLLILALPLASAGQAPEDSLRRRENYTFHFQQTLIDQYHPVFRSPYAGKNSLQSKDGWHMSYTSSFFAGARLWKGAEGYFDPEVAGGSGISSAFGMAGFPNGETFRVGDPAPTLYVARLFIRQHISLSNKKSTYGSGCNKIGDCLPERRITITAGKICMADIFDNNSYSHDARSQFFNWALMDAGAWDYPANTRGYTYSATIEYITPGWAVRAATSMVPQVANGPFLDLNFNKAHSETVEIERAYKIGKNKGVLRLLGYRTEAHMGNYKEVLNNLQYYDTSIVNNRRYGRTKTGFAINIEQDIGPKLGTFMRWSWNDGKNETWAFTEIDRSLSAGIVIKGSAWKRNNDNIGIAFIANGLSGDHRRYLAEGGYGFIIGDGRLDYGYEMIAELQYVIAFSDHFILTPDYQFAVNPAYNKSRGPVNIFGMRAHVDF